MISPYRIYKIASYLSNKHVPLVPKALDYFNRLVFSCWLPHSASIGRGLVLGYGGLGIVIHSNCCIGNHVHIDQGVTIGGNGTSKGVPLIADNVYIGAGAKILGPLSIGEGSIVGANAVVISDVAPKSVVVGVPAKVIKTDINIDTFLFFRRNK